MVGAGPQAAWRTQQKVRSNGAPVVQVGDQNDGGIDAAAYKAVLDGVALELMESHRDARKGSPEARQQRRQEVAGHGVADGNVDGTVNRGSPAMRSPHRI